MRLATDRQVCSVLMVDDDEEDYVLTRELLQESVQSDFAVQWVRSYDEALLAVTERRADICLLDYRIGARSGLELLAEVNAGAADMPFILLTGQGAYDIDRQAMQAGAVDYLEKAHLTAPLLERSIRYALARKRAETALRQRSRELACTVAKLDQLAAQLEAHNDNLLSILNELRVGAVLTDRNGLVTFVSRGGEGLFSADHSALGRHWQQVFPFNRDDLSRLHNAAQQKAEQRHKVTLQFTGRGGKHCCAEVEIRNDPRDRGCLMFFIYDTTPVQDLRRMLSRKGVFHGMVGKSDAMQIVFDQIGDLSKLDSTVLIEGHTGTGKEMVARAIHERGHRQDRPFVALNCAGLTESLLASQLFGHKRGAFTGAVQDQAGVFETADGGTLFLDEIGDISANVQMSLLRVLQEREIIRLGETQPRKVNVRIIAATHRDLNAEVQAGRFRADLLYRIRVARISLPTLSERRTDIPLLVELFLREFRAASGKAVLSVTESALCALLDHDWPGNVRELQSAIEFGAIRCKGPKIHVQDLPPELRSPEVNRRNEIEGIRDEREKLLAALMHSKGNRSAAAKMLNIGRTTLYRRLKWFDIR